MQLASPLRQPAARTGASRRETILGPTQRMLARPDENMKMDDQPEKKTMTDNNARDDRASVLRKAKKLRRARENEGTQRTSFTEPHPGRRRAEPPDEDHEI